MIDIEKFICSLLADHPIGVTVREDIHKALKDQGLKYKGGKIVPIEDKTELKESEGEKIRKQLITQFTEDYGKKSSARFAGIKVKDIIAWLEKPSKKISLWKHWKNSIAGNGEGKPIFLVKVGNTYSLTSCLGFECDYIELSELDDLMLEKQSEQIDLANKEYWRGYREGKQEILDKYSELEKQGEQKPTEWHREDEQNLNACLGYIPDEFLRRWLKDVIHTKYVKPTDKVEPKFKVGDKIRRKTPSSYDKDMQVARIEKDYYICNHIGKFSSEVVPFSKESSYELVEQNPAWSEEDEKQARQIERIVHDDGCTQKLQKQIADWFKSLKDRYTWKPSDEQMKQLGWIAEQNKDNMIGKELMTLYNDLKKLKG